MSVIFKNITYPNIIRTYSTALNVNTRYESSIISQVVPFPQEGLDTIYNFVYDFDAYLTQDLGLINIPTAGELDINNLPAIGSFTLPMTYGFKIYGFINNIGSPIYLKFTFQFVQHGASHIRDLVLVLSILNENYVSLYNINLMNGGINFSNGAPHYFTSYNMNSSVSSYGFNVENRFMMNICPSKSIFSSHSNDSDNTLRDGYYTFANACYAFYLERHEHYLLFIPLSGINSGVNQTNISTTFITKQIESNNYVSNENCFVPFINKRPLLNNTRLAFKTLNYNPYSGTSEVNKNLMTGYTDQLPSTSNVITMNVDGELADYMVFNSSMQNCYTYNLAISMLFRVSP